MFELWGIRAWDVLMQERLFSWWSQGCSTFFIIACPFLAPSCLPTSSYSYSYLNIILNSMFKIFLVIIQEIQCYICKSFGHLCCVTSGDDSLRQVSCYRCGELGHSGLVSPIQCFQHLHVCLHGHLSLSILHIFSRVLWLRRKFHL